MNPRPKTSISASILQRLKNYSQEHREDRGVTITNYAIERFLCRLSISPYAVEFVLKGAQLFRLWIDEPYRPTRDLDLLRYGNPDVTELVRIFQEVCRIETEVPDGIIYLAETVRGEVIREDNVYDGVRIKLEFRIGRTGEYMQIDIGFSDVVTPPAQEIRFPSLLGMPAPRLRAYTHETVVAEKVEAMVSLGMANSRMKDFYDVYQLSSTFSFDGQQLAETIKATFERRNTTIPARPPLAFTAEFAEDSAKQTQWNAFLRKNRLEPVEFPDAIERISAYISPVFQAIRTMRDFRLSWTTEQQWQ